mgnify:CR=1 FL=1
MKKKIIALVLASAMAASVFTACSTSSKSKDKSSKKHSRDEDEDDDDDDDKETMPVVTLDPDSLSYEEGYLPYYEKAESSDDSVYGLIEDKDNDLGIKRDNDDIYFFLDGMTLIGSDDSEYVFDDCEIDWYKNSDHSDNYHSGEYKAYHGCDAGIYMIANGYATAQSYTDYYDRNQGDAFYCPKNLIVIEVCLEEKTINSETSDEDVTIIFYGYTDQNYYELWGFVGDVSNGDYYYLNKK